MSSDNETVFDRALAAAFENANLSARPVRLQQVINRQAAVIEAQAARIEALGKALKPFVELLARQDAAYGKGWNQLGETMVPYADLRLAATTLGEEPRE